MDNVDRQGQAIEPVSEVKYIPMHPLGTIIADIEEEEESPTISIFWTMGEVVHALKTSQVEEGKLCYVISAIRYILPDIRPDRVRLGSVRASACPKTSRHKLLQAGFMIACHLAKPVTSENSPYLEKRWSAAVANLLGFDIELSPFDRSKHTIDIVKEVGSRVKAYVTPKMIAEQLYKPPQRGTTAISLVLREQLRLIYIRAGMVAIEMMYSYCKRPCNAAIGLAEVWGQALQFKEVYAKTKAAVEQEYPGGWLYARSLAEPMLQDLACANFPDLYYVAVQTAKRNGLLSKKQFQTSDKLVTADKYELDRRIRLRLAGSSSTVSDVAKAAMGQLGVDLTDLANREAILVGSKRGKDRSVADDDSDYEEAEDEVDNKRRRR